ncbi:hypothetical protein TNCV_975931 [Trichonephila clavipes]|nr:hypothetical protein TNCV_975931 [Trichonephila clavipes]
MGGVNINVGLFSYTRAFSDRPRHFEPWSIDEDDTWADTTSPLVHTNGRTFEISTDLTCIATRRILSGTGLELVTCQLRSDTLTTRLPRPYHTNGRVLSFDRFNVHQLLYTVGLQRDEDLNF